jgi:hypothetical protein
MREVYIEALNTEKTEWFYSEKWNGRIFFQQVIRLQK